MAKRKRKVTANITPEKEKVEEVKQNISVENVLDNLKVVQADFVKAKEFIKEVAGVDDIRNKVIVLRISYPADKHVLDGVFNSLRAINELLVKNNSTFILIPDSDTISQLSIDDIDKVINDLATLKINKLKADEEERKAKREN